jgi:simple sugar transport system permease protein
MSGSQTTPDTTTAPSAPLSPRERANRTPLMDFTQRWAGQIGITVAFLLLWVGFLAMAPDTFGSDLIYKSFGQTIPYFGIIAMMLTMVIVAGDIDLSFPSVMALGMVGFVWTWDATGVALLGIIAALLVGAGAGLFNGLVITLIGLPSLVVTIGTQFLFRGMTLVLVGGSSYALAATRGDLAREALVGKPLGLPMEFFWFAGITILAWILLNRHRLGGNTYVIGDNEQTARLMGVPIRRTRVTLFVLTGMAAALAGMMMSLQVVNFYPNLGSGLLLPALAAVFVGGTSVFGGRGSIYGTFLGALMIGAIPAGIVAAGLTDFWTQAIYGAIILIAISIHAILQRRFQR